MPGPEPQHAAGTKDAGAGSTGLSVRVLKRHSAGFCLDADFSIPPGITILFGASGSGKTTLLRCLAGLVRPDAGRIDSGSRVLFDSEKGIDVPVPRRGVGYLFQNLALFPHLTVEQNVQYGLARMAPDARRRRTLEILESFRIGALLKRRPGEISGGERQRVALARALVTYPRVLLLDEPLSALDAATKSKIIADLRAWNASHGIPILDVTHVLAEAFALGERVVVLDRGRVVAEGTPQQVLAAPRDETVAELAGFENIFSATVTAVCADHGTMRCRLESGGVELEVPLTRSEAGERVRVAIRAGDIMLATARPEALSARNVFQGTLLSLRRQATTVVATVESGIRFEVFLTPSALEHLQLRAGQAVWVVIKTYSCHLVG